MSNKAKDTKTLEFGADNGLLRACREMAGSCLKNSELLESFQQSPFLGKVREGCG